MYYHYIRKLWLNQLTEYQLNNPVEWHDLGISFDSFGSEFISSQFSLKTLCDKPSRSLLILESPSNSAAPVIYARSTDYDWYRFMLIKYDVINYKLFFETNTHPNSSYKRTIDPLVFKIFKDILHIQFTLTRLVLSETKEFLEFKCQCTF